MSVPGERRTQILHALAEMLEQPEAEKITTAALAARLQCSEAALYRHFASKARMYEGLIEFIETTLFSLVTRISTEERHGLIQARSIVQILLGFAERNHGMTRVLTGEVLLHENARLAARMNQLFDRLEVSLKQALRIAISQDSLPTSVDAAAAANLLLAWVQGRWQQFTRSGFKQSPLTAWEMQWQIIGRGLIQPAA
ncbi:MAG: nucleoid occlusion factor SlmA [Betaproteobacteria bacterium]|nr:MAG: nucleoid occlusion factor SlmA [Betaproteobacteria bacterium]